MDCVYCGENAGQHDEHDNCREQSINEGGKMTSEQMQLTAEAICNVLTDMDVAMLTDLLGDAVQACDYAADDLAERADYERTHQGAEEEDFRGRAESEKEVAAQLGALSAAIKRQNALVG